MAFFSYSFAGRWTMDDGRWTITDGFYRPSSIVRLKVFMVSIGRVLDGEADGLVEAERAGGVLGVHAEDGVGETLGFEPVQAGQTYGPAQADLAVAAA